MRARVAAAAAGVCRAVRALIPVGVAKCDPSHFCSTVARLANGVAGESEASSVALGCDAIMDLGVADNLVGGGKLGCVCGRAGGDDGDAEMFGRYTSRPASVCASSRAVQQPRLRRRRERASQTILHRDAAARVRVGGVEVSGCSGCRAQRSVVSGRCRAALSACRAVAAAVPSAAARLCVCVPPPQSALPTASSRRVTASRGGRLSTTSCCPCLSVGRLLTLTAPARATCPRPLIATIV